MFFFPFLCFWCMINHLHYTLAIYLLHSIRFSWRWHISRHIIVEIQPRTVHFESINFIIFSSWTFCCIFVSTKALRPTTASRHYFESANVYRNYCDIKIKRAVPPLALSLQTMSRTLAGAATSNESDLYKAVILKVDLNFAVILSGRNFVCQKPVHVRLGLEHH